MTATFSSAVTGFGASGVTVTNGTVSNFQAVSSTVYTFDVTPTQDGDVKVDIGADVAVDTNSEGNSAATQFVMVADLPAPTVTSVSPASGSVAGGTVVTITGTNFTGATAVRLRKASATNVTVVDDTTITATTPAGSAGTSDISVVTPSGTGSGSGIYTYVTGPTVTLSSTALAPVNGVIPMTATFSADVTGFSSSGVTVGNGSASNFQAVSGTVYTFDVTPTQDGTVTVDVAASVALDGSSQPNTAATQFSITADITAPTVALTTQAVSPVSGVFTVTATFSESVTGFALADAVVGNGSVSNFAGSGTTYTFDVTPAADGAVTVDIAAAVAQDGADNDNTAATQLSITADITAPTVALTTQALSPVGGSFTVTATFSENVTGFASGDISVGNGAVSNFAGSGTTYTFDVTPAADGAVTVDVAAAVAKDGAGNDNTAATQLSITADLTAPTVALTTQAVSPVGGSFTVTATFSENVTGFGAGDVTVGNGSVSNFSGSGLVYTFDVTPTADGTVTVDVAAAVAQDAASNDNTAATQLSITADLTVPTVALTTQAVSPVAGVFTVTATFSESVTGFALADLVIGNGTASNFKGSGTTYTFDVTPTADGTVTVDVAAAVAQDGAGNDNTAATQVSITADLTAPTVTLATQAVSPVNGAFEVTATFSENVTGFASGDISVGNGTVSNFAGSGTTYTFDVTPTADGTVTVDVAAAVAQDAAGNDNTAASQLSITADLIAPGVTLSTQAVSPVGGLFTVTATFTESVTGCSSGDVTAGNGTVSNFSGSGLVYTFDVTPTADGAVTVDVAGAVAKDAAGNDNTAATQLSITADLTVPTVALTTQAVSPVAGVFTVTATFSESVTGFVAGDVTAGNGTVSNFAGAGTTYTFDVTPTTDGTVTLDVAAAVAQDGAGNNNTAATQLSITADLTAPTVVLSTPAVSPVNGVFSVTATFSETVTGFASGDVSVTNGTVSNFAGSGSTYTFDVTPNASGGVTVDVAAAVAQDAAGNDNTAATQLSIIADLIAPTVSLTPSASSVNGVFSVTATFSESVSGFDLTDVVVGNGTASNLSGSGAVYSFNVTPLADGTVTVDIGQNSATDSAGNGNTAATQLTVAADITAPTVSISGPAGIVTGPFAITVTFSEAVSGFSASGVSVTQGTVGNVSEVSAGTVFTVQITPVMGQTVIASIPANVAQDGFGNGNTASQAFTVSAGSPKSAFNEYKDEVQRIIQDQAGKRLTVLMTGNTRMMQSARSRFIVSAVSAPPSDRGGNMRLC